MTLLVQSIFTAFVLFIVYLVLGPARYIEPEFVNVFLYLFLTPVYLIGATITTCVVIGLPLRISRKANKWWKSKQILPLLCSITGIITLSFTLQPDFSYPISDAITRQTNSYKVSGNLVQIGAWFLTAFSLLHFYPKYIFKQKVGNTNN